MSDYKTKITKQIEEAVIGVADPRQTELIMAAVLQILDGYDVTDRCTEVAVYDDANERILKRYMACLAIDGKSEGTAKQYRRSIRKMDEFLQKPFDEIGVYDIRFFMACEKERGLSNRSLENMRANLSAFFQWMTQEEIIGKNPCMNIKPVKCKDEIRKAFNDVELDAMRSACRNRKERALIELLVTSGVRVAELADLEVADISFADLSVHIRNGKGNKERVTYINEIARKHLQEYLIARTETGTSLFYNYRHEPMQANGIRHLLNEIGKRANVEDVHPHRFRRTFATRLAQRGMNVQEIQKLLGHASLNTTMGYISLTDEKVRNSYKQFIA